MGQTTRMRGLPVLVLLWVLALGWPARVSANSDVPQISIGLTTSAPAVVVGPNWLGMVQIQRVVAPPAPPALARWLASQAGVAYTPIWTPGGVVVGGGTQTALLPAAQGIPAAWAVGSQRPETGPSLHLAPVSGSFDGAPYRGALLAVATPSGVTVVNRLDVEEYLRGVVPAEVFPSWPMAALQAQAVAARTFTLRNLGRRAAHGFDLYADTRDQAYGGEAVETPATDAAVASTAGLVLTHAGQLIDAVYSANAGGRTASGGEVWGTDVPYLPTRPVQGERADAWAVLLPAAPILKAFPQLGGSLVSAALGRPSASGRVRDVVLVGRGAVDVPISALAKAADRGGGIRSSLITAVSVLRHTTFVGAGPGGPLTFTGWSGFTPAIWSVLGSGPVTYKATVPVGLYVVGRGYGHGAGLSQWGAYALAQRGWSFQQILEQFYPGTRLQRIPR